MGDKYIIELENKPFRKEDGDFLYRVKGFNSLVFDMTGIGMLTPYTEPDLERIRKEAYEKGYENGFIAGHLKAEKSGQSFYEDGYQCGLNDAWDTMRKIRGMTWNKQREVFETDYFTDIIALPASECIEKIRQYKQEKEEQIQVGDEVKSAEGNIGIVTRLFGDGIYVTWIDGTSGFHKADGFEKTGRHFPEIAEVLEKMRGEKDG